MYSSLITSPFENTYIVVLGAKSEGRETNIHGRTDPNNFLWIAATVADVAAVKANGIKTLWANDLSTFAITKNNF